MVIVEIIILVILITFAYAGISGAPWVPMHSKDIKRVLSLAKIQSGEKLYDLGCGDGRLICAAAKAGARGEGFEISLLPYLISQVRRLAIRKTDHDIVIHYKSFWPADISDADIVYFFQIPRCYQRIKEKLENELKPGARVIAYVWPIEGWSPITIDNAPGQPNLYLYQR